MACWWLLQRASMMIKYGSDCQQDCKYVRMTRGYYAGSVSGDTPTPPRFSVPSCSVLLPMLLLALANLKLLD